MIKYLERNFRNAIFAKTSDYVDDEKWHPTEKKDAHNYAYGNGGLKKDKKNHEL